MELIKLIIVVTKQTEKLHQIIDKKNKVSVGVCFFFALQANTTTLRYFDTVFLHYRDVKQLIIDPS